MSSQRALCEQASSLRWTDKGLVAVGEGEEEEERGEAAGVGPHSGQPGAAEVRPAQGRVGRHTLQGGAAVTRRRCGQVWRTLVHCSAVVGMHPDGATEAIVDFALAGGCRPVRML